MKMLALVTHPASIRRYLVKIGENGCAATLPKPRPAVLQEHRAAPEALGAERAHA
jgi:hypothetical protein